MFNQMSLVKEEVNKWTDFLFSVNGHRLQVPLPLLLFISKWCYTEFYVFIF